MWFVCGANFRDTQNQNTKTGVEIQPRTFAETLITAFEGYSNYWYLIHTDEQWLEIVNRHDIVVARREGRTKKNPLSLRIVNAILEIDALLIPIYDVESPMEKHGNLCQANFLNAIAALSADFPQVFARIINQEDDAVDADIFFQYCVLGQLKFG